MREFDINGQAVIMCGISGSGKTYYANRLEEERYERLSVDALIWEKSGKDLNFLPKEKQQSLFEECRKEINYKISDFLKTGKRFVVDATHCKRRVRDEIRELCTQAGVTPVFVYCEADKEVLWNRLSKRKGTGPDDLIVTPQELSEYWQGFERPQVDEKDFIFIA